MGIDKNDEGEGDRGTVMYARKSLFTKHFSILLLFRVTQTIELLLGLFFLVRSQTLILFHRRSLILDQLPHFRFFLCRQLRGLSMALSPKDMRCIMVSSPWVETAMPIPTTADTTTMPLKNFAFCLSSLVRRRDHHIPPGHTSFRNEPRRKSRIFRATPFALTTLRPLDTLT